MKSKGPATIEITWKTAPGWEKTHAVTFQERRLKWATALCGRRPMEGWTDSDHADAEPRCKQCKAQVEKLGF